MSFTKNGRSNVMLPKLLKSLALVVYALLQLSGCATAPNIVLDSAVPQSKGVVVNGIVSHFVQGDRFDLSAGAAKISKADAMLYAGALDQMRADCSANLKVWIKNKSDQPLRVDESLLVCTAFTADGQQRKIEIRPVEASTKVGTAPTTDMQGRVINPGTPGGGTVMVGRARVKTDILPGQEFSKAYDFLVTLWEKSETKDNSGKVSESSVKLPFARWELSLPVGDQTCKVSFKNDTGDQK
jgi:hypothetical protein